MKDKIPRRVRSALTSALQAELCPGAHSWIGAALVTGVFPEEEPPCIPYNDDNVWNYWILQDLRGLYCQVRYSSKLHPWRSAITQKYMARLEGSTDFYNRQAPCKTST